MKKIILFSVVACFFAACNNETAAPDVSSIKVELAVKRFDKDFFAMDTLSLNEGMSNLQASYPEFLPVFLQHIIGVNDEEGIKNYYRIYKPVYDSAQRIYSDFQPVKEQIEQALKYVKHYFPSYTIPTSLIPIIGPMNSQEDFARMPNGEYTPDFIGDDFIGISLQFYLGKNFSLYNDEYFINNIAPLYRSRRFSKEYIVADVMKLIADDIFPDKSNTKPLIEQMIEKGKHWWLLDKFLPKVADSVKTGYTQNQLNWCKANEGLIWTYLLKNEDIHSVSPVTLQTYIGEAPFTQGFSQEDSPGNIGPWIGWQIVKKYVEKKGISHPEEVMQVPADKILEESQYKPK